MKPMKLAIVGHTNVGKTSLLRTLARDSHFGKVDNKPGTTRHTEGINLQVDNENIITFFDTPGLEDSIALLDYLDSFAVESRETYFKIQRFLESPEAKGRFEQEAKVLRQLANSDAGLYVIDVREPILPKYQDELAILSYCGKPLLPVFNFTSSADSKEDTWREKLAQLGLHLIVSFDTVSPPLQGEKRLYDSLMLLLDDCHEPLLKWMKEIDKKQRYRKQAAKKLIADALIDVAAAERWLLHKNDKEMEIDALQNAVRERERDCVSQMLQLYQFDKASANVTEFPEMEGRFEYDLFSSDVLSQMGVRVSKGAITGAITGAGIDLAVGGATLGMATAIGALVGGAAQSVKHYGKRVSSILSGQERLTVDASVICVLSLRLQMLQNMLEKRGHAATEKVIIALPKNSEWQQGKLPDVLKECRAHPEWSRLNKHAKTNDAKRIKNVMECVSILQLDTLGENKTNVDDKTG